MHNVQEAIQRLSEEQRLQREAYEKRQQKVQENAQIELVQKILTTTYDKSAAYTNLVTIAGYVAFFTIWSNTKDYISEISALLAALLISVSATTFVLWEVYKMISSSNQMRVIALKIEQDQTDFVSKISAYEKAQRDIEFRQIKIWAIVLWFTIIPAVAGLAIMLISFIRKLLGI